MSWYVPGALVRRINDATQQREVDLLAVSRDVILMAEVKASAAAFDRATVTDLSALATSIGADTLLLATIDDWNSASRHDASAAVA